MRNLTEDEVLALIQSRESLRGRIKLTYESGPYDITRPTDVAMVFTQAVQQMFSKVNGLDGVGEPLVWQFGIGDPARYGWTECSEEHARNALQQGEPWRVRTLRVVPLPLGVPEAKPLAAWEQPSSYRFAAANAAEGSDGVKVAALDLDALMRLADAYADAQEEVARERLCYPGESYLNKVPAMEKARADLKAALQVAFGVPGTPPTQPAGEWNGDCVLGHCGSPSGCERDGCCRADPSFGRTPGVGGRDGS